MLAWISANLTTLIVAAVLAAILIAIVVSMIRKHKKGGSVGCGCGCEHCAMSEQCHRDDK